MGRTEEGKARAAEQRAAWDRENICKLTVSVKKDLAEQYKAYAAAQGVPVSRLLSDHMRADLATYTED